MATKKVARAQSRSKPEEKAAKAPTELLRKGADRTERAAVTHREAQDLYSLLCGGLYTDDDSDGLGLQDAALRVAAAQLRAIRFALATDHNTDPPDPVDGRQAWGFGDSFGKADAVIAIGGVMALLDNIWSVSKVVVKAIETPDEAVRQ